MSDISVFSSIIAFQADQRRKEEDNFLKQLKKSMKSDMRDIDNLSNKELLEYIQFRRISNNIKLTRHYDKLVAYAVKVALKRMKK